MVESIFFVSLLRLHLSQKRNRYATEETLKDIAEMLDRFGPVTLEEWLALVMRTLPSSQFMRVHRSYIVNLKKITEVSRLRIVFGETYIPVGENYKDQFTEYINSRMMK